ncbi:MAG: ABC transporter ATP-binding protein [Acidimicrobiales bacterium]
MLPDGTIKASHLWKRFRADRRFSQLRYEMKHLQARLRGASDGDWRWALKDVDLEVSPGEAIGFLGSNGSGKSTLLKVLCRVMQPHSGSLEVAGRVGALIEVVAGIHPDLSGRENAFLYGTLLGLSRQDIAKRFDDIVEFSEVGSAIDRQVKFYSSGMKMRLGFSVAAFLEPDVLLVDEVLAVGDAAFQQKCLERMRTVLHDGTTLVFVSHDLAAMEATCTRAIWLREGVVELEGPIRPLLGAYRRSIEETAGTNFHENERAHVHEIKTAGPDGGSARTNELLNITLRLEVQEAEAQSAVYFGLSEGAATPIFVLRHEINLGVGETTITCTTPQLPLPHGRYYLWMSVTDKNNEDLIPWHPATAVDVTGNFLDPAPQAVVRLSPVYVTAQWTETDD